MSMVTRSNTAKVPDIPSSLSKIPALRKVFFISEEFLMTTGDFKLQKFYHPGKNKRTFFITNEQKGIVMEILEFAEPRRSWLINQDVCSNGKIYLSTPFDTTFLVLHHLRKHCSKNAMALDSIKDEQDESVQSLLMTYVDPDQLKCIAELKKAGDMNFYKYSHDKTLAWLSLKVKMTANSLRQNGVHCGVSALSQNYTKSEVIDSIEQNDDYIGMAFDMIGSYIDMELHTELRSYLSLPSEQDEMKKKMESNSTAKRKSMSLGNNKDNKKIKLDPTEPANENLFNFNIVKTTEETKSDNTFAIPLQERSLTAKDKAFAKSAKGSKNISSYFRR